MGILFIDVVDDDGNEKWLVVCHVLRAIDGQPPLAPEVAFEPGLRLRRDDGDEQHARANLLADLLIPCIAAAKLALIEPDFDARSLKRVADAARRLGILRGIAEKDGRVPLAHRFVKLGRAIGFIKAPQGFLRLGTQECWKRHWRATRLTSAR